VRQRGPGVRALCEPVKVLLSKEHDPRATTVQRNAKQKLCVPNIALHPSRCISLIFYTSHFTLQASSQLISSQLFSGNPDAAITMRIATARCRTPARNQSHIRTNGPQLPRARAALHRRLQPLYPEKRNVSCSGLLPNTSPTQHSCSHYNAICNRTLQNNLGTNHTSKQTARNCRAYELPFTAGCSHFTRKNTMFRALASSPTQVPRNSHAAITMRFATARCRTP